MLSVARVAVLAVVVHGRVLWMTQDVTAAHQQPRPSMKRGLASRPVLALTSSFVAPPAIVATETHQKFKDGGHRSRHRSRQSGGSIVRIEAAQLASEEALRPIEAALQIGAHGHGLAVLVPPENVATESHQKSKGGGYLSGRPHRSLAEAEEVAPLASEELFPPIEPAGIFLPLISVLFGVFCLVLVGLVNGGKGPVHEIDRSHESIMRTIFDRCDLIGFNGNKAVNKHDLMRSIRAYQADNEAFLDLDDALQFLVQMDIDASIDASACQADSDAGIDREVTWNEFHRVYEADNEGCLDLDKALQSIRAHQQNIKTYTKGGPAGLWFAGFVDF